MNKTLFLLWIGHLLITIINGEDEDLMSSVDGMAGYGVWYSEQDILDVFNTTEFLKMAGVRALLATHRELLADPPYTRERDPPVRERFPFIAVEGTHRDSRIIMGKQVASFLQCTYLGNPPRSMVTLRRPFDKDKGVLRKAYFSLSMYVGAHHVRETWTKEPVVTTGYWLDQAAFSIAQRFTMETLPPPNSPLYHWPEDLVRPDVAFFLNIPQLKTSTRPPNLFKDKLVEVYRRMRGVHVVEINQTGTYKRIFAIMQTHLSKMFGLKTQREDREQYEHKKTRIRKPKSEEQYYDDYTGETQNS